MQKFAMLAVAGAVLIGAGLLGRPSAARQQDPPSPATRGVPITGIRSITLPQINTAMPAGPGQAIFAGNCTICHTPRYVLMQPPFPRKTWQAEVEKMKKVYGAPLADEQIPPIVDYLVSVRGNGK